MQATIKTICFNCKEPVGRKQEKLGKAYCEGCQKKIFETEIVGPPISKGSRFTREEIERYI